MATDLRELLNFALDNYISNKQLDLRGNAFAAAFKSSAKEVVSQVLDADDLIVEASVGQGNWAQVPWVCIFNPEITTSAQEGVYIGYWFSADMSGVYLVQCQGVTAVRNEFGAGCHQELDRRTELIRARVPEFREKFSHNRPVLKGTTPIALDYEHGAAYCKYYERGAIPPVEVLEQDFSEMLSLYDLLVARGGVDNIETVANFGEEEASKGQDFEHIIRYARHKRIERNGKDAREAKKLFDPICMACGFDFEVTYGPLGKGFIEAHHIMPLHTLPLGERVKVDPAKDIALLCSNCHRMVHRSPDTLDVGDLREIIKSKKDIVSS